MVRQLMRMMARFCIMVERSFYMVSRTETRHWRRHIRGQTIPVFWSILRPIWFTGLAEATRCRWCKGHFGYQMSFMMRPQTSSLCGLGLADGKLQPQATEFISPRPSTADSVLVLEPRHTPMELVFLLMMMAPAMLYLRQIQKTLTCLGRYARRRCPTVCITATL